MQFGETEGEILRIERSSIHDGRGLRTVLFLKGCPLSCLWCSTPESQNNLPEIGYAVERCNGCGTCVDNCPEKSLSLIGGVVQRDEARCRSCFSCVDVCFQNARKGFGRRMTVSQAVAEISKDEIFFFHSGGGVTISGGECLQQPDFTAAILRECRQRSIDSAVETSLFAPWANVEKIIPHLNDIYVDLKHPEASEHKKYVGVDNSVILENLQKLDRANLTFGLHLRIPLIPGINDGDKSLEALLKLANGLTRPGDIEILPYHRLGVGTYDQLGREYRLDGLSAPTREYIIERVAFLKSLGSGIPIKYGGGYF